MPDENDAFAKTVETNDDFRMMLLNKLFKLIHDFRYVMRMMLLQRF